MSVVVLFHACTITSSPVLTFHFLYIKEFINVASLEASRLSMLFANKSMTRLPICSIHLMLWTDNLHLLHISIPCFSTNSPPKELEAYYKAYCDYLDRTFTSKLMSAFWTHNFKHSIALMLGIPKKQLENLSLVAFNNLTYKYLLSYACTFVLITVQITLWLHL